MKRLVLWMLLLLLVPAAVVGQDDITMAYFNGGTYQLRFHFASSLFSGVGIRSEGLGGTLSALNGDPASIVRHPAALTRIKGPLAALDVTPPIVLDPASFVDLDASIESGVDDALVDYQVPKQAIQYPHLDIGFGQAGVSGSGGAVIPTPYGYVGLAVYHPFTLSFDMVGNGFSTMIETSKAIGENVTIVQFATQMNPSVRFRLNTTAAGFSLARPIGRHLAVGATVEWMSARVDVNAFFKVDGIMLLRQEGASAGQEYAFNDRYDKSIRREDGELNDLDQWAIGGYEGSGWGTTLSALYQPGQSWSFDFSISRLPTLKMAGALSFVQHFIPAVDAENFFSDDPNASLFDVTQLNLAKPTLTRRFENPTDSLLTLRFPTSITFGVSKKLGRRSLLAFNYTLFSGEFAYDYLQYHHGLRLKQGVRFGFTVPFAWFLSPETILLRVLGQQPDPTLRMGFGVVFADEVKSGFRYQNNSSRRYESTGILIPSFALGKSFWLLPNVETDLLLVGLPASFMKFSFLYHF